MLIITQNRTALISVGGDPTAAIAQACIQSDEYTRQLSMAIKCSGNGSDSLLNPYR